MTATITTTPARVVEGQTSSTRYRILVADNPWGGLEWSWVPEAGACVAGWASPFQGGEVRVTVGRLSKPDRAAIEALIDGVRS